MARAEPPLLSRAFASFGQQQLVEYALNLEPIWRPLARVLARRIGQELSEKIAWDGVETRPCQANVFDYAGGNDILRNG